MDQSRNLKEILNDGVEELYSLWDEIGLDSNTQRERNHTVEEHFRGLLERMISEEKGLKKKLLDSLEASMKNCVKLSKEMGVSYDEPDSSLVLIKLEHSMRLEAKKLKDLKDDRLKEVLKLMKQDEELCQRLGMDPYYVSSTTVPTTYQMDGLKDHIRSMEDEKFVRLEQFVKLKESILGLYEELESEPSSELEREVACEETDRFVLSTSNLARVANILKMLETDVKKNQKVVMEAVERLDSLYERLQLEMNEKFQFLAENQGHSPSVIRNLHQEIDRLEEIKKANIEKFVNTLRNELHGLWDACFYSPDQRNDFSPLHSIDFTEDLLDQHEAEVAKLKTYLSGNKELFDRVATRQEVWSKFMELERRAKDPSRLMNARGNSLLVEEKERNKVNKALPRIEQELQELIDNWENDNGAQFKVGGVSFKAFIDQQKEDHAMQLEAEKQAREKAKKETLLQETRYGAKPSTPAKLKGYSSMAKTPRKIVTTPSASRIMQRVSSAVATMRSPRAGRVAKGTSPRVGGKVQSKNKKVVAANEKKMKRGVLTEKNNYTLVGMVGNDTVIKAQKGDNLSVASTVPDYANFKQGSMLNSTEAITEAITPETTFTRVSTRTPSYMTPTQSAQNRMFKTPTTPASRSRLGTSKSKTPKLSSLRSGRALPFLF
eukprot:GFUD01131245.1.p1 GENE.GFUD01131245.1~~GFUD01131245.1.p1  ORF type:complete len:662 (-),score=174.00 GFUD01131245.1:409-2394(-)